MIQTANHRLITLLCYWTVYKVNWSWWNVHHHKTYLFRKQATCLFIQAFVFLQETKRRYCHFLASVFQTPRLLGKKLMRSGQGKKCRPVLTLVLSRFFSTSAPHYSPLTRSLEQATFLHIKLRTPDLSALLFHWPCFLQVNLSVALRLITREVKEKSFRISHCGTENARLKTRPL